MKFSRVILILAIMTAAVTIYFIQSSSGDNEESYLADLHQDREQKDAFMRSDQSPFGDSRVQFSGLQYFEPDLKYRVIADLEPVKDKKVRVLGTSTGEETRYLEYAWADFTLDGEKCRLLLLEVMDMGPTRGTLFLAFSDATSAKETYGAGRYLDVKKVKGATSIELDFNKAYNPYCAYADSFSCPFPPTENILKVAIRAGEKIYPH